MFVLAYLSGAGQMPESGDESQGIAVKGLLCPLRYPGSDEKTLAAADVHMYAS